MTWGILLTEHAFWVQ